MPLEEFPGIPHAVTTCVLACQINARAHMCMFLHVRACMLVKTYLYVFQDLTKCAEPH